jgi:hypothetical protein
VVATDVRSRESTDSDTDAGDEDNEEEDDTRGASGQILLDNIRVVRAHERQTLVFGVLLPTRQYKQRVTDLASSATET